MNIWKGKINTALKIKGGMAAILILFLVFFPLNFLKDRIEAAATGALQQQVRINGNITLGLAGWWRPALSLHDVEIKHPLASAAKVVITMPIGGHLFVEVDGLTVAGKRAGNYGFPVHISSDGYEISALEGDFGGGDIEGNMAYTGDRFSMKLGGEDIPYKAMTDWMTGDAAFNLQVEGRGKGFDRALQAMGGRFTLIGGPGTISSKALELWTKDLLRNLIPSRNGDVTGLRCIVADFKIANGIARDQLIVIDMDDSVIVGHGTVDLSRQYIDITLTPKPKDTSLLSLATPMRITGRIGSLTIRPVGKALAKNFGGMLLGSINPAIAVFSMLKMGSSKKSNPCAAYMEKK